MCNLKIGDHVRLTKTWEVFPIGIYKAGETGVLVEINSGGYWVQLDNDHPELADWANELQIGTDGASPEHPTAFLERI